MIRRLIVLIVGVCLTVPLGAMELAGVNLPDTTTVAGAMLKLNGMGTRKKLFFKIYVGGLYVKAPTHDAAAIIATA